MKIVQTISKDMNMNFGLEKCARICLKRGSVQSKMHVGSTFDNDIKELDSRKAYKYLGIEESFDTQNKNEKEKLKKEYLRRLGLVLGTELSAKNKIQAIGSLAVPVLKYSFGIVTQLCFMMDCRFGPTCGKLIQLADMLQVQNLNMLLQITVYSSVHYSQLTVHSSVRYTHSTLTHFQ